MLDKRDKQEIERLIEKQLAFEVEMLRMLDKVIESGRHGLDDAEVVEYLREQETNRDYFQGLLERVRAENWVPADYDG